MKPRTLRRLTQEPARRARRRGQWTMQNNPVSAAVTILLQGPPKNLEMWFGPSISEPIVYYDNKLLPKRRHRAP